MSMQVAQQMVKARPEKAPRQALRMGLRTTAITERALLRAIRTLHYACERPFCEDRDGLHALSLLDSEQMAPVVGQLGEEGYAVVPLAYAPVPAEWRIYWLASSVLGQWEAFQASGQLSNDDAMGQAFIQKSTLAAALRELGDQVERFTAGEAVRSEH